MAKSLILCCRCHPPRPPRKFNSSKFCTHGLWVRPGGANNPNVLAIHRRCSLQVLPLVCERKTIVDLADSLQVEVTPTTP